MKNKFINKLLIIDIPTESEIERRLTVKRIFNMTISLLILFILLISAVITANILNNTKQLPDIGMLKDYNPDQSTLIYDINNKLIANVHGDEDRVIVPLNKISPYLQKAVISIEDNRFYEHNGIDLIGISRAVLKNFSRSSSIQGGSSITQQLIKNSFLSSERSIRRKLLEAKLAINAERIFTKDKILEMYLNQIYWGNLSYGAEKAARRYFKISANDLSLAQSAFLAGIIKAPEGYSPYQNYKLAKLRQLEVLNKMELYGYITQRQRLSAKNESLKFAPRQQLNCKYPYFIDYVTYVLRKTYGDDVIRRGGLKVYTTLDPAVQQLAEKAISEGIKAAPLSSGLKQGAIVTIDVTKGYITALVGGTDYKKSNYNRAVCSRRAAGSSFKPIVYLTGLRLGKITPDSVLLDAPISFNTGWNIWSPHNWDGRYMGKMTVRKALTLSRNTVTVRVALKVGLNSIIETARKLGIKGKINNDFSITLGSVGISPLEMATVYSTFARQGVYIEPTCIRKVIDGQGNTIETHSANPIQVVNSNFVSQLNSILIDVVEKGTGKLAKLPDREVAGKTGTTDDIKDIWFTGFTPDTVTAIWFGNDENTGLKGVFSSNCAQLWGIYMKEYYDIKSLPTRFFPVYQDIKPINVNKIKKADLVESDKVKTYIKQTRHKEKNNDKNTQSKRFNRATVIKQEDTKITTNKATGEKTNKADKHNNLNYKEENRYEEKADPMNYNYDEEYYEEQYFN